MKQLRMFLANVGQRQAKYPLVTPPMGILYLAAHLRTKFDLAIRLINQRVSNCSYESLARQAIEFDSDIVGFGTMTPFGHQLPGLTKMVREGLPDALILLGGPHISTFGAKALEESVADAAVVGEGELACEHILRAWLEGDDFNGIPGLIWRTPAGEVVTNPGAMPLIEDLDSLPFPAYDLIDVQEYGRMQSMPPIPRRRYVSLLSSRGCPYRCNWCHKIFGKRFRAHSAERVVDEIEHYMKTFGIDDVEFIDDIFNHDRKRVVEFSEIIQRRNIRVKIAFPNAIRADVLRQEDVDALADAGTYFSSLALESGSPRIQKLTGKCLDIDRFVDGVAMVVKRGIYSHGFNMFGFPTETEAEMQKTIDVASNSMLHTASFFTVMPFPNTPLYDYVLERTPEKLANIRYDETDFAGFSVNLADVPDEVLYYYQRKANRQFFMRPMRVFRILRDFPQPLLLPMYSYIYLVRATKGLLGGTA